MIAIHQGETAAFDELYARYQKRLLYYFYRMLGNSNEKAGDFLQDIFMKIIERPNHFDASRRFRTWLFSVAHNMCKNEYRRLSIRKNVVWDSDMDYHRRLKIRMRRTGSWPKRFLLRSMNWEKLKRLLFYYITGRIFLYAISARCSICQKAQ